MPYSVLHDNSECLAFIFAIHYIDHSCDIVDMRFIDQKAQRKLAASTPARTHHSLSTVDVESIMPTSIPSSWMRQGDITLVILGVVLAGILV